MAKPVPQIDTSNPQSAINAAADFIGVSNGRIERFMTSGRHLSDKYARQLTDIFGGTAKLNAFVGKVFGFSAEPTPQA